MQRMLVIVVLLACGAASADAQIPSPLRLNISPATYCGTAYDARSEFADFIFYTGEEVRLRLMIGNSDESRAHDLLPLSAQEGMRFQVSASKDGEARRLELAIDEQILEVGLSEPFPRDWRSPMRVDPLTDVVWQARLQGVLEPGNYTIEIVPLASDEKDLPITMALVTLEIRRFSAEVAPELTRRQSCYAMLDGRYDEAIEMAQLLLMQQPNSSLAHAMLADIAERQARDARNVADYVRAQSKMDEAQGHWQRAVDLLVSGRDALFVRHAPQDVSRTVQGWRVRAGEPR
jgi:tetratricopeptide (TPR) repeat protein